jgi:hypothetical protein
MLLPNELTLGLKVRSIKNDKPLTVSKIDSGRTTTDSDGNILRIFNVACKDAKGNEAWYHYEELLPE